MKSSMDGWGSGLLGVLIFSGSLPATRVAVSDFTPLFLTSARAVIAALLGAALLGIGGDEIIHSLLDIMYARAPYTVIKRAMHIHPTVAELIPTMLEGLQPLT